MAKKKTVKKTAKPKRVSKPKMQLFRVNTSSVFQISYLVEATSPDAAEECLLEALRNDIPPVEWQQSHFGEFVTELVPITLKQAQVEHAKKVPTVLKSDWLPVTHCIIRASRKP